MCHKTIGIPCQRTRSRPASKYGVEARPLKWLGAGLGPCGQSQHEDNKGKMTSECVDNQRGVLAGTLNLEQCVEQLGGCIMGWPARLQKGVAGHNPWDKKAARDEVDDKW